MSIDYCLKCPEWGGDGICNEGYYDDPSEPWCVMTLGGELLEENPFDYVEPNSSEYFELLWNYLKSAPGGEKVFWEIVNKEKNKTKLTKYLPSIQPKSIDMLGEELLEIHKEGYKLSFNEILDLLREKYERKLTFSEKINISEKVREFVKKGKLKFENGKTFK